MDISWLGHSCFRIRGSQAVIITDPFPPDLGYTLGKQTARIVTVSHNHPSHSYIQGIGGEPKIVSGPGEYEIADVFIIGMATYHDDEQGKKRGRNTVYLMEIDGISVCHLGDLGHILTADRVGLMDKVDVLMIPVGGVNTLNATMAAEVVRQIVPKIVIPMHYKTPAIKRELDPLEKFLKEMGVMSVKSQSRVSVSQSSLPLSTQVVVLDYKG
jgi:L-ascorbate metabolism protein UlaG (beta-lactamase superfamily)